MPPNLIDAAAFRRIAEVAFKASTADDTFVSLADEAGGTTRFANNQIVQNVSTRRQTLTVSVAFKGKQYASSATSDLPLTELRPVKGLSDDAIHETVKRAVEVASILPDDPEYLPPLPPQRYPILPTFRPETAETGPERRIADARRAIEACAADKLSAAGIVANYASAVGLAASTGLFAYEQRTLAEFRLTASGVDSSGSASDASRSIDELNIPECVAIATNKARCSAGAKELPPGRYTVILEPAAVAGLFYPLLQVADARSYYAGTSALVGKLDRQMIDRRLRLQNRPDHPGLLGDGFDEQGLPSDSRTWIESGVLQQLCYDRFTASRHEVPPTYSLDAPHLSGKDAAGESVDDLIKSTQRGVLVTDFWYVRVVNASDLTLTGMTRDGTFLVEDGQIVGGLKNFRWHESPLRAFNQVEAFTTPMGACNGSGGKGLFPAMKVRDFNFTSLTRF